MSTENDLSFKVDIEDRALCRQKSWELDFWVGTILEWIKVDTKMLSYKVDTHSLLFLNIREFESDEPPAGPGEGDRLG